MKPKKIIDIDSVFDDLEDGFFDEVTIARRTAAKLKKGSKQFGATMKIVAADRFSDPDYVKKFEAGLARRANTYQAISNNRDEVKEKISKAMTGKKKSAEHLAKVAAKNKERSKIIHTPWGTYESRLAAVSAGKEKGISNPAGKIDSGIRNKKEGFYYVEIKTKNS